jgi:hypothetical protein
MRANVWASAILAVSLWATARSDANAEVPQSVRDSAADWAYNDCSEKAYPLDNSAPTASKDAFCRCFGDYLTDLLTDDEIVYLATYLEPTLTMVEKEQRARMTCNAFAQ